MDIDTYTLIHFCFHSVQCVQDIVSVQCVQDIVSVQCVRDIVRVNDSFNFYLFLILGTARQLRVIIAILDWIHKGVN